MGEVGGPRDATEYYREMGKIPAVLLYLSTQKKGATNPEIYQGTGIEKGKVDSALKFLSRVKAVRQEADATEIGSKQVYVPRHVITARGRKKLETEYSNLKTM